MPGGPISRVYAGTLLDLAREAGRVDRVAAEVEALRAAWEAHPSLRAFLGSPRVEARQKKRALRDALGERLDELTLRFVELLVERERQDLLGEVLAEFAAQVGELRNQSVLEVTSATPLSEALRERVRQAFARATGREIVLRESVDAALVGGIVAQLGDTRIDGSLRTRLENLRERMLRGARAARPPDNPEPFGAPVP